MAFDRLVRILAVLVAAPVFWAVAATAQDRGTPEEAQAMAEEAAAFFQAQGPEAAFEAFSNGAAAFQDRDLYVFVLDVEGNMAAHGANENLIGRTGVDLRDPSGRQFIRDMVAIEGTGWVEYQWQHPQTGSVEDKATYVINLGDYVLGVGAYK